MLSETAYIATQTVVNLDLQWALQLLQEIIIERIILLGM